MGESNGCLLGALLGMWAAPWGVGVEGGLALLRPLFRAGEQTCLTLCKYSLRPGVVSRLVTLMMIVQSPAADTERGLLVELHICMHA